MARTLTPTEPKTESSKKSAVMAWVDTVPTEKSVFSRWPRKIVRVLMICLREMNKNVLTLRAGYLTYAILLSMVPMLAMSTALFKGLGGGDQLRDVVYSYVESLEKSSPDETEHPAVILEGTAPAAPVDEQPDGADGASGEDGSEDLAGHLTSAVDQIFDYVDRTNFATLGTFGMVGILFSVIMVLGQVEKSLNVIWKVEDGRSFLRKVSDYLALMIMMPISLNVALAAGTMLKSQSLNMHVDKILPGNVLQILLLEGVPIFVLSFTLYIVYIFFPNTKTRGTATMIGALVAGTGWFITQNIYISMQIGVAKYNAIYGSFATIPLFLAWVWVGCMFVLLGAQIAYAIQIEPLYQFFRKTPKPVLQISAGLDICTVIGTRFKNMEPTRQSDVAKLLPEYNQDLLDDVLEALIKKDILHYTRKTKEIMPSRPIDMLTNQKIVETVLGRDLPGTPGGQATLKAMNGMVEAFPAGQTIEEEETEKSAESAEDEKTDVQKEVS